MRHQHEIALRGQGCQVLGGFFCEVHRGTRENGQQVGAREEKRLREVNDHVSHLGAESLELIGKAAPSGANLEDDLASLRGSKERSQKPPHAQGNQTFVKFQRVDVDQHAIDFMPETAQERRFGDKKPV